MLRTVGVFLLFTGLVVLFSCLLLRTNKAHAFQPMILKDTSFLFAQPGICPHPNGALRYRVTVGGVSWVLPIATPEGHCTPLTQFLMDQFNAGTLSIACGYTDGRPMSGWTPVPPITLAFRDGRCGDGGT